MLLNLKATAPPLRRSMQVGRQVGMYVCMYHTLSRVNSALVKGSSTSPLSPSGSTDCMYVCMYVHGHVCMYVCMQVGRGEQGRLPASFPKSPSLVPISRPPGHTYIHTYIHPSSLRYHTYLPTYLPTSSCILYVDSFNTLSLIFSGEGSSFVHLYIHTYKHTYIHTYIDLHAYLHTYT